MCDLIHAYVCDMNRLYAWHDTFTYVTWPVHTCNITPWHALFIWVTWLIHMCVQIENGEFECVCLILFVCVWEREKEKETVVATKHLRLLITHFNHTRQRRRLQQDALQRVTVCCSVAQVWCKCVSHSSAQHNAPRPLRLHTDIVKHCNTMQFTTAWSFRLHTRAATHSSTVLRHTAAHQQQSLFVCHIHTAIHYNTLQHTDHTATHQQQGYFIFTLTLQHTAAHCNKLQHNTTHCHTPATEPLRLPHTHCNTLTTLQHNTPRQQ